MPIANCQIELPTAGGLRPRRAGRSFHSAFGNRTSARAFTLLELIMVMAIVVLIAGYVAPKLGGFATGRRTTDAGTRMVALANYARTQAISEACAYRLNLDKSAGKYWLTKDDGTGKFAAVPGDFGQQFTVPEGVKIDIDIAAQADGLYIAFQSDGRVDPSQITLSDVTGGSTKVACESATESYRLETGAGT